MYQKNYKLRLKECEHIIVCNPEFEGGRAHDVDGIQIKPNSRHIWIDRCTLHITRQSTDITVSRCCFGQHDKTMLIGPDPTHIVTLVIDASGQRQPCVRFGKVHLYNNYTRNWGIYAVCASVESQIYSQCNAADKEEQNSGFIISGDMFLNGAEPCLLTENREIEYYQTWTMEVAAHSLREVLKLCTGWQSICRPVDHMDYTFWFMWEPLTLHQAHLRNFVRYFNSSCTSSIFIVFCKHSQFFGSDTFPFSYLYLSPIIISIVRGYSSLKYVANF
ncbi:putative pectate lyase 4 [Glycine max]|nr:putative pectate lyase 4 [Glycine max]